VHREAIEDGGGEGRVAEVAAPLAERDVRGDRGGDVSVPTIESSVTRVVTPRRLRAVPPTTTASSAKL